MQLKKKKYKSTIIEIKVTAYLKSVFLNTSMLYIYIDLDLCKNSITAFVV